MAKFESRKKFARTCVRFVFLSSINRRADCRANAALWLFWVFLDHYRLFSTHSMSQDITIKNKLKLKYLWIGPKSKLEPIKFLTIKPKVRQSRICLLSCSTLPVALTVRWLNRRYSDRKWLINSCELGIAEITDSVQPCYNPFSSFLSRIITPFCCL